MVPSIQREKDVKSYVWQKFTYGKISHRDLFRVFFSHKYIYPFESKKNKLHIIYIYKMFRPEIFFFFIQCVIQWVT